jgi:hypothetical protein
MNEVLESCHLCGADMGSRAPICPKCFARSDPEARQAIRNAILVADAKAEQRRRLKCAREHEESDQFLLWCMFFGWAFVALVFLCSIFSSCVAR